MSAVLQFRLARFFSGLLIVAALWASAGVAFRAHSDSKNPLPLFALWGVLLLLCSPIGLQQSFGVSSDVPVFAFGILLASLLASGQHWNVSIWALFVPTAWSAFQTKPVLAPLLIPILMSPRLGPRLILTGLFSYGIISGLFTRALSSAGNGGDTALQKAHILENPLTSLAVILGATLKKAVFYSHWMFGTLGWFDHSPSHLTIVLLFGGLIGLWIQFATKARWSETPRQATLQDAIFMASWLGSASLITLALYLTWTVPGSDRVTGVQGRYFLAHQMVIFGYLAHRLRPAGEMDRRAPGLLLGTCASLLILRLFETWSHYH